MQSLFVAKIPKFRAASFAIMAQALALVFATGCSQDAGQNGNGNIFADGGAVFTPDAAVKDGAAVDATSAGDTGGTAGDTNKADVPACKNTCNEGSKRCEPNGGGAQSCLDEGDSGCFNWGTPTACGKNQVCEKGACVTSCPKDACTVKGTKKCGTIDSVLECGDFDGDGCNEWGKSTPCGSGKVCSQGLCASTCSSSCTKIGAKKCDGNSVVVCGDHDGNGCLNWGKPSSCGAQICANGACEDTCKNECTTSGAKKCDGKGYKECKDYNKDGCLTWGSVVNCKASETCSSGACLTQCKNECTAVGAKKCELDKIVTCGDFNSDGCLEWGTPVGCAKPLVCQGGFCATSCKNECTVVGAKQCDVGGGVVACGDYNKDGCLEWGTPVNCSKGQVCSNGQCALSCTNACKIKGQVQCVPGSTTKKQTCDDYNKDGCLEWGTATDCGKNLVCAAGKCASTCTSTCTTKGAKQCDGNAVKTCGDYNADGCLEWGTPVGCASYELCIGALCKQKPAPSKVLINELVYDSVGKDVATFVELKGPAGADLTGYTLVGMNGDGGALYNSLNLTGKIGSDGFFVVAHSSAPKAIADQADQKSSKVDFQNGPDSVQLRYGGKVVDAVGYGSFSGKKFGGEGKPAVDVAAGHSLGRDASSADTDDNSKDFKDYATPTPGTANTAANKPPVAKLACPGSGAPGTMLQFDASKSYDPEGQIDQYTFDFGDGSTALKSAQAKVNYTYKKAGTFTVKLTVIDNGGATASATCVVGITAGNQVPTAKLSCPGTVSLNQTFSADASASSDNDGTIAKYTFNMGDGSALKAGTASKVSHAYKKAGTFTASVTVMDDKGATAKATCSIKAIAGTPPSVTIIKPFDGKQVTQGDVVPVIVDATPPAGKSIAKVEFFIDGKSIGTDSTAPYEVKWTVPKTALTGSKAVLTATATDSAGTPGTSKPVSMLIANDKPKLSFTAVVSGKLKVVLDANGVSDTESAKSALQVRVDWENDGKWDTAWSTSKVYEHTFPKEGKFTIKVAVRDEAGQETVGTKSITLSSTLTVSGNITTTTWTGTVVVTGDLIVPSGHTLTIAPGTSVLFTPIDQNKDGVGDFDLVVNGKLVVKGTKDEPVTFTVYGKTKTAGKGWNRVKITGVGSTIDYAVFEYAQTGLEVRAQATVSNSVFQQNRTGVHANQGAKLTLKNVTGKDNVHEALYVTSGGQATSTGGVWQSNGMAGVKAYATSSATTYLNMNGDDVQFNKQAGVEVGGYVSGLVTKTLISNNGHEGVWLYNVQSYDPKIAFRLNNITENATVGAHVYKKVTLSATTPKYSSTTKYSSAWKAPTGGYVTNVYWSYSESDHYNYNYITGSIVHGTSTAAFASSTKSRSARWDSTTSTSFTSVRARVIDSSGNYYGTATLSGVIYWMKGAKREATVITNKAAVDMRHNYWGVFPAILPVLTLSHSKAATLDGFVGKYFDKTWTRAPYYGGESLSKSMSWSGQVWITGDLTIGPNATVTVAAGTKVSVVRHDQDSNGTGDVSFSVVGHLKTNGTAAQPVTIGPADSSGKPRAWERLYASGGLKVDGMTLNHTIVEYGTDGITIAGGKHTLNNVTVRKNGGIGLIVNGGNWVAKNLVSKANGGDGVRITNAAGLLSGGTVEANGKVGVRLIGTSTTTVMNMNIIKNIGTGVRVENAKPTLKQLNVNYNGLGVMFLGKAAGSLKASNMKYNQGEGIYLLSQSAYSPAPLIDGNNIYGNSVKAGGVIKVVNYAATTAKYSSQTKVGSVFTTPKGEKVIAVRATYSESDHYNYNYITGYIRAGTTTATVLLSMTKSSSAKWYDVSAAQVSKAAPVVVDSSSSYYGTMTLNEVFYRSASATMELASTTYSGKVKCTNNYWGTFPDVAKKFVLSRKDAIDFQGFKINEVNGTGPQ